MAGVDAPRGPRTDLQENGARAERLVDDLIAGWEHPLDDLDRLLDAACAALAQDANYQLRQVLAQVSTDLELLGSKLQDHEEGEARIERMLAAIDRASEIVSTFLDPTEISKHIIRISPEQIDLGALVDQRVRRRGLAHGATGTHLGAAPVHADPVKLTAVIDYLIDRFVRSAPAEAQLSVTGRKGNGSVEVRIGCRPAPSGAGTLMEELEAPLELDALGMDLPYARAVIERHGGALFVDRSDDEGIGVGFRLPLTPHPGGKA